MNYLPIHKQEDKPHDKVHRLSKQILRLLAMDSSQCSPCNQTDFQCFLSAKKFAKYFLSYLSFLLKTMVFAPQNWGLIAAINHLEVREFSYNLFLFIKYLHQEFFRNRSKIVQRYQVP